MTEFVTVRQNKTISNKNREKSALLIDFFRVFAIARFKFIALSVNN